MRQPEAVVEVAQPGLAGDLLQALNLLGRHELAADVAFGDESEVVDELLLAYRERLFRVGRRDAVGNRFELRDAGVAQQDLEARAHFMNPVVDRLQLGGLVDYVFGRRHLAAIVQPGTDTEFAPLVVGLETKIRQRTFADLAGLFGQHRRQFRNALAMVAGVGALRVDGAGQDLDHRFHQFLLCRQEVVVFECDGRLRGQRFDVTDQLGREGNDGAGFRVQRVHQLQHAHDLVRARR